MRFDRRDNSPPPYVGKARSRLWGLMFALMFVLMGINIAADPATWTWLFPTEADQATATPTLEDVTYTVQLGDDEELRSDEFRAEPSEKKHTVSIVPSDSHQSDRLIGEELLDSVKDNTLAIRAGEREAYSTILRRLRDLDDAAIHAAADPTATFPAVMLEPDHYRGRLMTIDGTVRRVTELPPDPTVPGQKPPYELWMFTPDSGDNPWRVVATSIPEELQREAGEGGALVRATGVFFKRQGYETLRHELHVAPLLLAKTVDVRRTATATAESDQRPVWLLAGVILLAGSFLAVAWRIGRTSRGIPQSIVGRRSQIRPNTSASSSADTPEDPSEFLANLSEQTLETPSVENGFERTKDVHR